MTIKKILTIILLFSFLMLVSCAQEPYVYNWIFAGLKDAETNLDINLDSKDIESISIYIKFRPDDTLEFRDKDGMIYSGTYIFDENDDSSNLTILIDNNQIDAYISAPLVGSPELIFSFKKYIYIFYEGQELYWEYSFPQIDEIKDLYNNDSNNNVTNKVDDDNTLDYLYNIYADYKELCHYDDVIIGYATIETISGIDYIIDIAWVNVRPINSWESITYYNVIDENTIIQSQFKYGPCLITYQDLKELKVLYFDNYIN